MSLASRGVNRLRKMYRTVMIRMRELNHRMFHPGRTAVAIGAINALEPLEPRLMLSSTLLEVDFNAGVDANGADSGQLVFDGADGFAAWITDDGSAGSYGGDADGVHITNLDFGNIKDGHATDLVLGAFNDMSGPGQNYHSSGIRAYFAWGVEQVSLDDTDDDATTKTLFAFDYNGALIGQTAAGSQQTFTISTADTGGALIHSVEFDTLAGTAGGSTDGTYFTIDNLQVVGDPADAPTLLDVYDWNVSQTEPVGKIAAIATAQTGAQHYDYTSASAHPSSVVAAARRSNLWIHENTNTGEYSFGFIFDMDNSGGPVNLASQNFRIVGSDADPYVSQSDDPGEAVESPAGSNAFVGGFSYGDNTDGISVSGITGVDWTLIIDSVSFGDVNSWYAAGGASPTLIDDIALTIGHEYRIVPAGQTPAGVEVNPSVPRDPSPADEATDEAVDVDLAWSVEEPAGVTYDVYFGTETDPPLVASGEATATYDPGLLAFNTAYHWRIVSHKSGDPFDPGVWSFTTIALPDLVISAPTAPTLVGAGELISLTWRTDNVGTLATPGPWTERILLSTDDQISGDDIELYAADPAQMLAPAQGLDRNVDVTLPVVPEGIYYLLAVADSAEAMTEQDETNNLAAAAIDIRTPVTVVTTDPTGHTADQVAGMTLELSGPVVGDDARDAATYELVDLGADRAPGGGDDIVLPVTAAYSDGNNRIDLVFAGGGQQTNLNGWTEHDYGNGSAGDWRIEDGGASVKQYANGLPTYYVSDFDFIDRQFTGRIRVETTGDDDFIGVVWGFATDGGGAPDSYYVLTWKQGRQSVYGVGEEGFKLLKMTDTAVETEQAVYEKLWDGENWPGKMEVLGRHNVAGTGWRDNVEYDFTVLYQSNGKIDIEVRRTSDSYLMAEFHVTDPAPLGTGKVGFINISQSDVRYSGLLAADFLEEGAYQLTARSGAPGLRDADGIALDGDGDGGGGDDWVTTFVIDHTAPAIAGAAVYTDRIEVQFDDAGGMDPATVTDPANYTLTRSAGAALDVTVPVTAVSFDDATGVATLTFDGDLEDDVYQLTVSAAGVADLAGHALNEGVDEVLDLTLDAAAAAVAIDLQSGSDTGESDSDDLTTDATPTFDYSVSEAGLVSIDWTGDGIADYTEQVAAATFGTFTPPTPLAAGTYDISVTLDAVTAAGSPATTILTVVIDRTAPQVTGGAIAPTAVTVTFADDAALGAVSIETAANYTLIASGGDGTFDDGNEVDASAAILTVSLDGDVATLTTNALPDEMYRLVVAGSVEDAAGNPIGADVTTDMLLDAVAPEVTVDLQAGSDSGASDSDDLTNAEAITLDVTVNEAGSLTVSYDGGTDPQTLTVAAGTHSVTFVGVGEGAHTFDAALTPLTGAAGSGDLDLTVDRTGVSIVQGSATVSGPVTEREIALSETPATPPAAGNIVLTGPGGAVTSLAALTVGFDELYLAGAYTLGLTGVTDLAGNTNTNDVDAFDLIDDTHPWIVSAAPSGFVGTDVTELTVVFSERIDPATLAGALSLQTPGGAVTATSVVGQGDGRTFVATVPLQTAEGDYTGVVAAAVSDFAGNSLAGEYLELIYQTDFESGADATWSTATTTTNATTSRFLGRFSNGQAVLTLSGLPLDHQRAIVEVDAMIIDSWDFGAYGYDYWGFDIGYDGSKEFWHMYSGTHPDTYTVGADVTGNFIAAGWGDRIYRNISRSTDHTGDTLQIQFTDGGGLQGLGDESWGIDNVRVYVERVSQGDATWSFSIDKTGPTVIDAMIEPGRIEVTYDDPAGMDEASAESVTNYTLVASGGDGSFAEGNEVAIDLAGRVGSMTLSGSVLTMAFNTPLPDEAYRLTIDGDSTVTDAVGNPLNGGYDEIRQLTLDAADATVSLDLQADSDSGVSDSDDLTNIAAPTFDVTVSEAGLIRMDFDGDGSTDEILSVAAAGSYAMTAGSPLADGPTAAAVTFDSVTDDPIATSLTITVDTDGPRGAAIGSQEIAPWTSWSFAFSEPIVVASLDLADIGFTAPGGADLSGDLLTVVGDGIDFTVTFAPQVTPGDYLFDIGPGATDLAGNAMNQDADATNGEPGDDVMAVTVGLLADNTPPRIIDQTPDGPVNDAVSTVRVTFGDLIDADSFTGADVTITTPTGVIDPAAITVLPVGSGELDYTTLDFAAHHNMRWQSTGGMGGLPVGETTFGGVPFSIPTVGNNTWSANGGPVDIDVSVGVFGADVVHTLINTIWGVTGTNAFVEFFGSDGAYYRKDLYGNADIRDYNHNGWTNTINNTTTTMVWSYSGISKRIDKQAIDLPDDFLDETLETIRFSDRGGSNYQRIALYGATVGAQQAASGEAAFMVSFPAQSDEGAYQIEIGPDVQDLSGNDMAPYAGSFGIDTTGPQIVNAAPAMLTDVALDHLDVTFDSAIDAGEFTAADVHLTGPAGAVSPVTVAQISTLIYRITFAAQTAPGDYAFTIGPDILDAAGNAMDQNADGTAGDPIDDVFAHTVSINDNFGPHIAALTPVRAVGGDVSVLRLRFSETIDPATFGADDVQVVTPAGAIDPADITIAQVDATTFDVTIPTQAAEGRYEVTIGPDVTDTFGNPMVGGDRGYSTILVFEPSGTDGAVLPQSYGDNVTISPQENFLYATGADGPYTPNITVSYGPTSAEVRRGLAGFGDLLDVIYRAGSAGVLEVTFSAAAGEWVALHGFDLAAVGGDYVINGVEIVNEHGAPLFAVNRVIVEGDSDGMLHTHIHLGDGIIGQSLTLRIDAANLGDDGDRIGLDNIEFSQVGAIAAPSAPFVSGFEIDRTGPAVTAMAPEGPTPRIVDYVDVTFDTPIAAGGFTLADVTIAGPQGPVAAAAIDHVVANTYRVSFPAQSANGLYTVTVGPDVTDPLGNPMAAAFSGQFDLQLPNLTVASVGYDSTGAFGAPVDVTWTVENVNAAGGSTTTWGDRIYFSTDPVLDAGDELLAAIDVTDQLPLTPTGSYTLTETVLPPLRADLLDGQYYFIVVTDAGAEQAETDEADNTATGSAITLSTPPTPNLTVTDIVAPAAADAGETVTIQWTVANLGTADIAGIWEDRISLAIDPSGTGLTHMITLPYSGELAAGASVVRNVSITLPATIDADRWVVVTTDVSNLINEHADEDDNVAVDDAMIDVSYPALPDLVVESITLSADPQSGQAMTLDWTVRNIGQAGAPIDWTDRIIVANTTTGAQLPARSITVDDGGTLAPGGTVSGTTTFTLPDGPDGVGALRVTVATDHGDAVFEVNAAGTGESNNALAVDGESTAGPVADLSLTGIDLPTHDVWSGRSVVLGWTVTNDGAKTAASSWTDRVVLRPDGTYGPADIHLDDITRPTSLATGASYDRVSTFNVPADISGLYRIIVTTNQNHGQYEDDYADNTVISDTFVIHRTPEPDLVINEVVAPTVDVLAGGIAHVQWTVTNVGTGSTNAPYWYDRVYLSANQTLDGADIRLTPDVVNPRALGAAEGYVQGVDFTVPAETVGEYYVIVRTDVTGKMAELNESNNIAVSDTTFDVLPVQPAQVDVIDVGVFPANLWPGDQVNVSWKVTNTGEVATGPESFDFAIVLSQDSQLDQGVDRVLRFHVERISINLQPGDVSGMLSTTVNLPTDLDHESDWHIIVWPDPPQWADFDRSPAAAMIDVQQPVPSDLEVMDLLVNPTGVAGMYTRVSWTVRNALSQPTRVSNWNDRITLSRDDDIATAADNIILGDYTHHGALGFQEQYVRTVDIRLPVTLSGTYYAFVETNVNDRVLETGFTDNNILGAPTPIVIDNAPPDLTVTGAVFAVADGGDSIEAGSALSVAWSVRNVGAGLAPNPTWTSDVILSADQTLDAGDLVLSTVQHVTSGLGVGSQIGAATTVTIPLSWTYASAYVFIRTDADYEVFETNESNNTAAATFVGDGGPGTGGPVVIIPPANLRVISVNADTAPGAATFDVSWTVHNYGGATEANAWIDHVYVSTDAFFDPADDALVAEVARSSALGHDGRYIVSRSGLSLPVGLIGTAYIFVKTDATDPDFVAESNETDNVGSDPINNVVTVDPGGPVGVANLIVSDVDAAAAAFSGQLTTVSWTVANIGDADTIGSRWRDSVYLSLDQFFDGSEDLFVGSLNHSSTLAAGGSYAASMDVRIPRGMTGPYYVLIRTDSGYAVPESNNNDNITGDGQATFVELTPLADLAVDAGSIAAPAAAIIGDSVRIDWTVDNLQGEAVGSWSDAVYLSLDQDWDIDDIKIGEVRASGPIADGGDYDASLTTQLPGMLPGEYYVIVTTDLRDEQREAGGGQANNASVSAGQISVDAQEIFPGVPIQGALGLGEGRYFKISLTAGQTLQLALDSASVNGVNELFLLAGDVAGRGQFDYANANALEPDPVILAPIEQTGEYYILAYATNVSGTPSFTLTATLLPFTLFGVEPADVGQTGPFTLKITGAQFDDTTHFELVGPTGQIAYAHDVLVTDSTAAYVTFNLDGRPGGSWSLRGRLGDGATAELGDAIDVTTGHGSDLRSRITGPGVVRPNRLNAFTLHYENAGDVDAAPPLLVLVSNTGTPFGLTQDGMTAGAPIFVLGTPGDGPLDRFRPGSSYRLSGFFQSSTASLHFDADVVSADSSAPITDWNVIEQAVRPGGLDDDQWGPFWLQIQPRIGDTWGELVRMLNRMQIDVSTPGDPIHEVRELFAAVFDFDAMYTPTGSINGRLFDSDSQAAMAGVEIRVIGSTGVLAGRAVTDAGGRFTFGYLLDDTYNITVNYPHVLDQDRNGLADPDPISVLIADATDVTDLTVFALETEEPEPAEHDQLPAITMDGAGNTHMAWVRGTEIWHAWFDGDDWLDSGPIPGAFGDDVRIEAADNLIDGNGSGLIVLWQAGQANEAELQYAAGVDSDGDGAYEWSAPVAITNDGVFDNAPAMIVTDAGEVVVVYQKSDFDTADDTDLYYDVLSLDADDLQFDAGADVPQFILLTHLTDPALAGTDGAGDSLLLMSAPSEGGVGFSVNLGGGTSISIPGWVPIIGGGSGLSISGTIPGTANKCTASAGGSLGGSISVLGGLVELSASGSGSGSWNKNDQTNSWEFSSGNLTGSAGVGISIPILVIPIPQILGYAKVSVGGSANGQVQANWDSSHPFGGPAASTTSTMTYSVSVSGEIAAVLGLLASAKITGSGVVSSSTTHNVKKVDTAKLTLTVEATLLSFIKFEKPWEWILAEDCTPLDGAPADGWSSIIAAAAEGSGAYVLADGTYVTIQPVVGTGAVYGDNSILADISGDLFNDGPADLAAAPDGSTLAAWAKDDDPSGGTFGSVVTSRYAAGVWSPLETIPATDGYNSEVQAEYDVFGNLVVAFRHADMSGVDLTSTAQEAFDAVAAGRLTYAVKTASGWTDPADELALGDDDRHISLGAGADGELVLSWVNVFEGRERLMASVWDGAAWSEPRILADGEIGDFASAAEIGATDRTVVFWVQDVGAGAAADVGIQYVHLDADGRWSAAQDFDPNAGFDFFANVTVAQTGGATAVAESGANDHVSVVLTGPPMADVYVDVLTGSQLHTVGADTLTFTAANWNQPQIVTISAVDDTIVEGRHEGLIEFNVTSLDARYDNTPIDAIDVGVTDNDKGRVQISVAGGLNISEDGLTGVYQIVLLDQPDTNVTVTVRPDHESTATASQIPITFTPTDWNTPRFVTVGAVDDIHVEGVHTSVIRHSTTTTDPMYAGVPIADAVAVITDNDQGRILIDHGVSVNEAGGTGSYNIRLSHQPSGTVRITAGAGEQTDIVAYDSLVFTPENWDQWRTITIAAVDDDIDEANPHHGLIRHTAFSSDPMYNAVIINQIPTVWDDDTAGVVIRHTGGDTTVEEAGPGDSYEVFLTSEPTAAVVIDITPDNETFASPQRLVFTPSSWSTPRSVNVEAVDDLDLEGPHSSYIQHAMTSDDPAYNGGGGGLVAAVIDNEEGVPGVAISTDGRVDVQEEGHDDEYRIWLTGKPAYTVTVNLYPTEGEVSASPSSVSFNESNWDQPQIITVTANADGDDDEGLHFDFIEHEVSSGDPRYTDMTGRTVRVYVHDVVTIEGGANCFSASAGSSAGAIGGPPATEKCKDDDPPYEPPVIRPSDPNDILGPDGYGEERWVSTGEIMPYTIRFENQPTATATAQQVVITQQLDPDLDWRTFQLGDFGWGDHIFQNAGGRPTYSARIDLTDSEGFYVDVIASINVFTGEVQWILTTIDPATGEQPVDARVGFLPINDDTGAGEGFVRYTIYANPEAATRDIVDAEAGIVFDTEEAIDTPPIFNAIDNDAPVTKVDSLPDLIDDGAPFTVSWAADDGDGSGLASVDVYVSRNGAPYTLWLADAPGTESVFTAAPGRHQYAFYTVGADHVGNIEAAPVKADATTTVGANNAPVVTMATPIGAQEGEPISLPGFFLDEDFGDSWTATVDYGDGDGAIPLALDGHNFMLNYTYPDDGPRTLTVSVTDAAGETGLRTRAFDVANAAPTIDSLGGDAEIGAGAPAAFSATAGDPAAAADPLTFTWDFGDGTGPVSGVDLTHVNHTYLTPDDYTVTLTVSDGDGGQANASWAVTVTPVTPPVVESVTVDDGSGQRSMVRTITVVFDAPVTLGADAITITDESGAAVDVTVTNESGDRMTYVATVTDDNLLGGSLADGHYRLTVAADGVAGPGAMAMTDDHVVEFHRLFGDVDGDRDVDRGDYIQIRNTLGLSEGQAGFRSEYDYDADGTVDILDVVQIRSRLNTHLSEPQWLPAAGEQGPASQPQVVEILVNDGSEQRSRVTHLIVAFDKIIIPDAAAFVLTDTAGDRIDTTVSNPSGDRRTFILTVTGPDGTGGSLADGQYTLTVRRELLTDAAGISLTGADEHKSFHRLYGDTDGDRDVDLLDFGAMKQSFGALRGSPTFDASLDHDGNGVIDLDDFVQLSQRFNKRLP